LGKEGYRGIRNRGVTEVRLANLLGHLLPVLHGEQHDVLVLDAVEGIQVNASAPFEDGGIKEDEQE
jgi:hypothetical protein